MSNTPSPLNLADQAKSPHSLAVGNKRKNKKDGSSQGIPLSPFPTSLKTIPLSSSNVTNVATPRTVRMMDLGSGSPSPVKTSSTGATYRTVVDMSGWVNKGQSRMPTSVRRFFRLADSILYNHSQVNTRPSWKLSVSRAVVRADHDRNLIFLTCPSRSLRFQTSSAKETNDWLMSLRAAAMCNINDFYSMGRTIGTGSFGAVREAVDKTTKVKRAIKIVHRTANKKEQQFLTREMDVLLNISHPNVIRTYDIFDERHRILVVMSYVPGGDLFDFVKKRGRLDERTAKHIVWQVVTGIRYLHDHNIVHRDIKLENVLVANSNPLQLQLTDFGFANFVDPTKSKKGPTTDLNSMVGTGSYMAPEVIDGRGHGTPVDIFAAGVVMYRVIAGQMPFRAMSIKESYLLALNEKADFVSKAWQSVSSEARALCREMLSAKPGGRPSASDILGHGWFTDDKEFLEEAVCAGDSARKRQEKDLLKEQEVYDKSFNYENGLTTEDSILSEA